MNVILYPFMVLAACGLVLSIGAHFMALVGATIPGGKLVWSLHIGIFVVWIPAMLTFTQMTRYANRGDYWKAAFEGCPIWMRRAVYGLFGYAILNFLIFIVTTGGQSNQPPGDAPPSVVRGFSGHWMVFYGAAFAILYSRIHLENLYRPRKCPQGHDASPAARFCPECGYRFPSETSDA